jgi:hypothetical protein
MRVRVLSVLLLSIVTSILAYNNRSAWAEQVGSSPESGTTSRIKTIYDSLITLGHGSTEAGIWGDWGVMWNRIRSAAEWVPNGSLAETDVISGKTFYNLNRFQKTGTLTYSGNAGVADVAVGKTFYSNSGSLQTGTYNPHVSLYTPQSLETKDDYLGIYKAEESTWTNQTDGVVGSTGLSSGEIRKDERTGLWWSASSTSTIITNSFSTATDGVRPTGGNAIAFCTGLNTAVFGGKNNWYLPTQKELMQAYIDGIYSQDTAFGTTSAFWSSTEHSLDSTFAWYVLVDYGYTNVNTEVTGYAVRCVRRD